MNNRTPIILLVLCLTAGGGYILWHNSQSAEPQANSNSSAPATALMSPHIEAETTIREVRWQHGDGPLMIFERAGDDAWTMLRPVKSPATAWMVNDLILAFKGMIAAQSAPGTTENFIAAGLTPHPIARARFESTENQSVEVEVGRAVLGGGGTQVRRTDRPDTLTIVDYDFSKLLSWDPDSFRDRQVVRLPAENIVDIIVKVTTTGRSYALHQTDEEWRFTAPFDAPAQSSTLDAVVKAAARQWIRQWVSHSPDDLSALGFDPPALVVTIAPEDQSQAVCFELSSQGPAGDPALIYIRRCGASNVGTTGRDALDVYAPRLSEWRHTRLVPEQPWTITSITLSRQSERFDIQRSDQGWTFNEGRSADLRFVNALVEQLTTLDAVSFLELRPAPSCGLDPPQAVVELSGAEGQRIQIEIGAFTESLEKRLRFVRIGDTVAKVRATHVQGIFAGASELADRTLVEWPSNQLRSIALQRTIPQGQRQAVKLTRDENGIWRMSEPLERQAHVRTTAALASAMAPLRGLRLVAESDAALLDFADPLFAVVLEFDNAAVVSASGTETATQEPIAPSHIEFIGSPDRMFARRIGRDGVFEIEPGLAKVLQVELLPTSVWDYDPEQVAAVRWTRPEGIVSLTRGPGGWACNLDADLPIQSAAVQEYLKKLKQLATQRYLVYSASDLAEYDLEPHGQQLTLEMTDGSKMALLVSSQPYPHDERFYYAVLQGRRAVFVLGKSFLERAALRLEKFE